MRNPKILSRVSRSTLLGSALLLAALFGLVQVAPVQAQTTQNKIAFSRDGELWTMNGDGSGQMSLGLGPAAQAFDPTWSPDGKKIAFVVSPNSGGDSEIYRMSATDGANRTNLTNDSANNDGAPSWQPLP